MKGDTAAWGGRAWPLALLLLFAFVIRVLPSLTRPASPPDDCERVATTDVAAMERCIAMRPDDIELMIDLAAAHERAGRRARAEALYMQALGVDPRDAEVRTKLDALKASAR